MTHTHARTARRLLTTAALAALLPLAAACGSSTPAVPSAGAPEASSASSAASAAASSSTPAETTSTSAAVAEGSQAYCSVLESGQKELESMSKAISDSEALAQGKVVITKIEEAAPAEVKDAWGDLIAFIDAAAAGDKTALTAATTKMESATTTIEKHAKSTCNLDIS